MCNLVRHRGGAFAIPTERYARYILHVWRALYPAITGASRAAADSFRSHRRFGPFCPAFWADVDHRETAQPRESSLADHEHSILEVLQKSRCEHSSRHRVIRSVPRRAIPLARLDLQSQPRGERQQHRRIHALRVSTERIAAGALRRLGFRLWLALLF